MTPPELTAIRRSGSDHIECDIALPHSSPAFDGHFPDRPVLPGVVQIDWAMHLANDHLALGQRVARTFQVKFRRIITPHAVVTLSLRIDRAKPCLHFEYRVGKQIASTGRVTLEEPS